MSVRIHSANRREIFGLVRDSRHRLSNGACLSVIGWWLLVFVVLANVPASAEEAPRPSYEILYEARVRSDCIAEVNIRVNRDRSPLTALRLRIHMEEDRQFDFDGDGTIEREDGRVIWNTPDGVGELRYKVRLDHQREPGQYDARCTEDWAIFRGEDLFPPTAVHTRRPVGVPIGRPHTALSLQAPHGWSIVTPFPKNVQGRLAIEQPHRLHDRPTGWIIAGRLVVKREKCKGVSIAIASPVGEGVRHLDMLALLRWTLPTLKKILPELPQRFLVVSAGDPMWRGALSGPDSLYVHAEQPLIWRDATSPLLHEVIHVVTHAKSADDGDWVVEGLAEYYSLELLRRSRTISKKRYEKAHAKLAKKGRKARQLKVEHAHGAVTARAVAVMRHLDERLRKRSAGKASLDDALRLLQESYEPLTTQRFRSMCEQVAGGDLGDFFRKYVGE
jgi:hypothetical protein